MSKKDPLNTSLNNEAIRPSAYYSRQIEIEDWLNRKLYHPLAFRLAKKLSNTPITPNIVSIFGGLIVILASYIYTLPYWPVAGFIGLMLHMTWHIIDGADGDLARLTGKASPLGEIVDGLSDYISHIILYCMLAYLLSEQIGPLMAWLAAICAGLSRILQANHYEVSRRQYQWLTRGRSWLGHTPIHPTNIWGYIAAKLGSLYLTIAKRNYDFSDYIDTLINETKDTILIRKQIADAAYIYLLPHLKSLTILGANYRTIILGFSILLGSPLWYFIYEITILNILLYRSSIKYKQSIKCFCESIEADLHKHAIH